jgi:beta-galactosidase
LCIAVNITAQELPLLGAQVFIEPGQTEAETDLWFRTMKENGMEICRIRMFESYMLQSDGSWDFSVFDRAFRMAEKYDVKVMGTFFPATEKTDIGGWKFPKDDDQLEQLAEYIKQLTLHFKQFKSLYAWVLINEPGGGLKDNAFSKKMRAEWDKENPQVEYLENGYPVLVDLQDERFKEYMTSWMLNWIAEQVRKYDADIHLHVNNHAIFNNLAEYDFPYWRTFLNSMGGSAHPSWHFGLFSRQQYTLAMSANSEILLSGAGGLPWLMTEIQGGNNTYSAQNPMYPTKEEITQWLWTIIATEGKGGIFWSLNPRASGVESGEWALLDFQHQATDRVEAVKKVSDCISANQQLFRNIQKADPKVNLLYIRESLWAETVITKGTPAATDGRKIGMKNLLGYFKAFSEMGVSPNIGAFEEFDFSTNNYSGESIILANQIALPLNYVEKLESFVSKGGKLLVDGLTAYYDENVHNRFLTGSPYEKLFGGKISEFKHCDRPFLYEINGHAIQGELWLGIIKPAANSEILAKQGGNILAVRSQFGEGEVIWIPGLLGMAAWNDAGPLASFLMEEFRLEEKPCAFADHQQNVTMKTLKSDGKYVTVVINKSSEQKKMEIVGAMTKLAPKIIFSDYGGKADGKRIEISPEETMVIVWE